jgi:hypothetical protein
MFATSHILMTPEGPHCTPGLSATTVMQHDQEAALSSVIKKSLPKATWRL